MKLILVPTDMSETASHALRYASAIAEHFDAHLLVIYADSFLPPVDFGGSSAFAVRQDELVESAREQLEMHVEGNVSPSVPYDARVLARAPIDAILEQACDSGADLIVMGTHGRTGLHRLIAGSVTEAVMRLATVPVIAVNSFSGEAPSFKKVVCPVTFTTASLEALRYAATFAENSALLLFRGVEGTEVPNAINELIALQDWIPKELLSRAEMKVVPHSAAAGDIADFAKRNDADLIALGIPAPAHLLDKLLHFSPCPVLTLNERTVRLSASDRNLPLTAIIAAR